jgi:hypothetical protein
LERVVVTGKAFSTSRVLGTGKPSMRAAGWVLDFARRLIFRTRCHTNSMPSTITTSPATIPPTIAARLDFGFELAPTGAVTVVNPDTLPQTVSRYQIVPPCKHIRYRPVQLKGEINRRGIRKRLTEKMLALQAYH